MAKERDLGSWIQCDKEPGKPAQAWNQVSEAVYLWSVSLYLQTVLKHLRVMELALPRAKGTKKISNPFLLIQLKKLRLVQGMGHAGGLRSREYQK